MDALLTYDAGPRARPDHRRRMEALADALLRRGFSTHLEPTREPVRAGLIVCDSDRTRADDRALYRADRIVAIDDLGRDLAVDVLVDPSPGSQQTLHRRARCVFTGARYALVDPTVCDVQLTPPREAVRRVLVTGTRSDIRTSSEIANSLTKKLDGARIRIANNRPSSSTGTPLNTTQVESRIIHQLAAVDLVIAQNGVMLYEALALGRPTIAVGSTPRHRHDAATLAAAGAAYIADADAAASAGAVLASDLEARTDLFNVARRTIDGLGAARVADEVARQMSLAV